MKLLPKVFKHMRRSPYQAMAAILTMFLTFLLGGFFLVATTASVLVLTYFESKPQITVFFTDKSTKEEADTLASSLKATGKVADTKYISKEDALSIYREQNKNDPLLLEMVTADILPASLEVSTTDPDYLKDIEPMLREADGVEEVVYQKDVVETLLSWTRAIRVVGGLLAGVLALDSLLIIMTVIGMKIALKKEEIEILKLVGASPWYIRMPFIFEGGMYGVIGAISSWAIITGLIIWIRPAILSFLGMIPSITLVLSNIVSPEFLLVSGGFLASMMLMGFFLGSIGSMIALGRYLKL